MQKQTIPVIGGSVAWKSGQVALLILALAAAFGLDSFVESMQRLPKNPFLLRVAGAISRYGDLAPFLISMGSLIFVCAVFKQRLWRRRLCLMALAGLLAGGAADTLRLATGRTRPNTTSVAAGWYGVRLDGRWIVGQYRFSSFPSGHTALICGAFVFLWFAARRWSALGLAAIPLVAWSRLYLDCHHFSDVLFSIWIGLAVGYATWTRSIRVKSHVVDLRPIGSLPPDLESAGFGWRRLRRRISLAFFTSVAK